jgi:hypothetical protein
MTHQHSKQVSISQKLWWFLIAGIALFVSIQLSACGGGGASSTPVTPSNAVPSISSLSPASAIAGAAAQTLTINGANFLSSSTVTYNGVAHTPTFVSSGQLTIPLTVSDQAMAGTDAVVVSNPSPGGGASNSVNFTVNNPAPTITTISPASAMAGTAAQTLTINGTNFLSNTTVTLNGVAHTASLISSSQMTIQLSASDQALSGVYPIVATNPAPGGGASNAVSLTVNNPAPSISALSIASVTAGASAQTLTINGSGFVSNSAVTYNNVAHAATFVSTSQLTITLTASDLVAAGTFPVVVTNSAPGGGSSAAANLTVNNPIPSISNLSPSSVVVGATAQTLSINGANFVASSTVTYNGVAHQATFVNNGQLTIALSASDQATAGSFPVVVTNPAPGGGASSAVNFAVNNPVPAITSLSPASAIVGATVQNLTINGSGFLSSSTVTFNGVAHSVSYVNAGQLTISLSASDQTATGSFPVIVTNPAPGGGSSPAMNFAVNNPAPSISTLSPSSAVAGATSQSLMINGSNFVSSSSVIYNGVVHTATFVNSGQLTITLGSSDLSTAGAYPVVVTNPAPGGGSSIAVSFTVNNPAPTISALSPASVILGATGQTLTINGSNFLPTSTVTFNGASRTSTFINAGQLTISLSASDQATAGAYPVVVTNPAPGGGASSAVSFAVNNPVPAISSLSPASAIVGAGAQTLTINGSNFLSTSTVTYNGVVRTATFVNSGQLTISLNTGDQATAGLYAVVVSNPTPGGGASSATNFVVNNPSPTLASITPTSTNVGAASLILTLSGTNFTQTSSVLWDGSAIPTTYNSATSLSASIPGSDMAAAGTFNVMVNNPTPGGGSTTSASFTVNNPLPTISSLSPSSTNAGGVAFTLTVLGTNFVPSTVVQWNGSARATTFVSQNQLTVSISASDIASVGSNQIAVINATPGGGTPTAAFIVHSAIPANALYVATTGSDTNSGTFSAPFATIQKCATTAASGQTCVIRGGTYRETVTPNSGITLTSYYGESVIIDGTDPVTGWTSYQGSIYQAPATLSSGDTNQIFVNGQMMTEARWPNGDDLFHVNWATLQAGTNDTTIVDSNLPSVNWAGARVHLWSGTDAYDSQTGVVTASGAGQLTFTEDGADFSPNIQPQAGGYYYLFGTLAALDTAKEWYYNPTSKTLYFWAPGGVNPNTLNVTAKQRTWAIDLSGKSNVIISGIGIFGASINSDANSNNNIIDGITAQYVSHFTTLPNTSTYSFPTGYWYDHSTDSGIVINGSGNTLQNSTISWSAGNGVVLVSSGNTVKNNLIHHVGYMASDDAGIQVFLSNQTITHNTVYTTGRFSIQLSPQLPPWFNQPNNYDEISYNNTYGSMVLSVDGGEIYAGYATSVGSQIDHNWVHGSQSLVPIPSTAITKAGIYLDNGAGFTVDQNVVWNNSEPNIFLGGDGSSTPLNANVYNNSIPDSGSYAYILLLDIATCGTTSVTNNYVLVPVNYWNNPPQCASTTTNNNAAAPGATDMVAGVSVGCTLAGCYSAPPPVVSGGKVAASVATDPWDMTVSAGNTTTFSVIANGDAPLSYQWLKNGIPINGATGSAYTTPAVSSADNGSTFTVQVSNSVGSAISAPATLTVQ